MKKLISALLLVLLINSCSSESVTVKYYLLDKQSLPAQKANSNANTSYQQLAYNVQIQSVDVAKAYDQTKIAMRTKSNEIKYFYYHTWAELPSSAFANFILKEFKESKLFQTADFNFYRKEANYYVTTNVYQLERIHFEDNYAAHLKMSFELKNVKTGNSEVSHSFDKYLPIEESDAMNIFVQKINDTLEKETKLFIAKINKVLNSSDK